MQEILDESQIKDIRYALIQAMKMFDEKGNEAEKRLSDRIESFCKKLALEKSILIKSNVKI